MPRRIEQFFHCIAGNPTLSFHLVLHRRTEIPLTISGYRGKGAGVRDCELLLFKAGTWDRNRNLNAVFQRI